MKNLELITKTHTESLSHFVGALSYRCLMSLTSFGMLGAFDILNGKNGIITREDIQEEMLLWLFENLNRWNIGSDGRVNFIDTSAMKELCRVASRTVYGMSHKHYSRLYVSYDDMEAWEGDIYYLSAHVLPMDMAEFDTDIKALLDSLEPDLAEFFRLRWEGYTLAECAKRMRLTINQIRGKQTKLRKAYDAFFNGDSPLKKAGELDKKEKAERKKTRLTPSYPMPARTNCTDRE